MASSQSFRVPRVRHVRKSIAHMPSADAGRDKENFTVDTATIHSLSVRSEQGGKKSRSKSLGPGGLDALREDAGNRQVSFEPWFLFGLS